MKILRLREIKRSAFADAHNPPTLVGGNLSEGMKEEAIGIENIEVAIKYFEKRNADPDFKGKVNIVDVLKVLYFLKQCEKQALELIGIGYATQKGDVPYEKLNLNQMYEGGFAVAPKK